MENKTIQKEQKDVETLITEKVKNSQENQLSTNINPKAMNLQLLDQKGLIQFATLDDLWTICGMLRRSGMLPRSYDTTEKVATGILFIKELGLPPLNALKNIAIINGTPCLFGDMPLAMVRGKGQLESFDEYLIDKNYSMICMENKNLGAEIFAAICVVKRKGCEKRTFTLTSAEAAKNPNIKSSQAWSSYYSVMIKRRIRSIALKDEFPDVLLGMDIAEYNHDMAPDLIKDEAIPTTARVIPTTGNTTIDSLNDKIQARIESNVETKEEKQP